jgi:glycolate oxidase iron-sulfur subunit
MQTHLSPEFQGTAEGAEAEAILRKCVHCGFCTATCPTYQVLGDELDGPRGRIYLIKQVLEGEQPTRKTQLHLDRCLTCRNCESTCPSGVDYGNLVDIGRAHRRRKVPRGAGSKALRWTLKEGLTSPLFAPAMKLGQSVRGCCRRRCATRCRRARTPAAGRRARMRARCCCWRAACSRRCCPTSTRHGARARCGRHPGRDRARAGCCGAVKFHLNDQDGGARRCAPTSMPGGPTWSAARSRRS